MRAGRHLQGEQRRRRHGDQTGNTAFQDLGPPGEFDHIVQLGQREFGQIIVVRCIDSKDARKATARQLPWPILQRITRRITAIPGVNRCLYDLTPKPPATVEYI